MHEHPAAVWPTKIILRLLAANLSTTANQLSATSVLIQQNQHGDCKQNDMASFAEALFKAPTKSERNLCVDFLIHPEQYANTCMAVLIRRVTCESLFSFWGKKKSFKLQNLPSRTSTSFLSRRVGALFLFWTATKSATFLKNFQVTYILHIMLKESTLLRGNLYR